MADTPSYLDGDDLCAGCGICCHNIEALRVTDAELERLPRLAPHVTRREGAFTLLDIPGPCPYLRPDGRCGTFETRPFDCSLYPVNVSSVGVRRPDGSVQATWMFTAQDCPERPEFVALARRRGVAEVAAWVAEVTGAERVELVAAPWTRLRAAVTVLLHRVGLLQSVRRTLGRPAPPVKPARPER